jgi:hypothetical protein
MRVPFMLAEGKVREEIEHNTPNGYAKWMSPVCMQTTMRNFCSPQIVRVCIEDYIVVYRREV